MKTIAVTETPTSFLIPADDLRAAFQCVSNEQARYYLNGVFVTMTDFGVSLIGLDGHVMLVIEAPDAAFIGSECCTQEGGFILKTDPADKAFKAKTVCDLWIYGDTETGILQFVDYAPSASDVYPRLGVCEFEQIDGTFPDWTYVVAKPIPSSTSAFVSFNPTMLTKMTKAADVYEKGKPVRIMPTDGFESPYRVAFAACDRMSGMLMPYRWDKA